MVTVSAFSTNQSKVEVCPCVMVVGAALKRMTRGAVPGVTCTVTVQVAAGVPVAPVAVIVYVVVCVGVTICDPLAGTLPIPGEIFTELAFSVEKKRVAVSPATMLVGVTWHAVIVAPGFASTTTVVVAVAEPRRLLAVKTYCVVVVGLT